MRCPRCNASMGPSEGPVCEECRTILTSKRRRGPRAESKWSKFARLSERPEIDALKLHEPDTDSIERSYLLTIGVVAFVIAVLTAALILGARVLGDAELSRWVSFDGWARVFGLLGMTLVLLGAALMLLTLLGRKRFQDAPIERELARVMYRYGMHYQGRGLPGLTFLSAQPEGGVTLELAGGGSRELAVPMAVYKQLRKDQYGMAFIKGQHLLDFERIEG